MKLNKILPFLDTNNLKLIIIDDKNEVIKRENYNRTLGCYDNWFIKSISNQNCNIYIKTIIEITYKEVE